MALTRVGVVLGTFGVRGFLKCSYTTDHPEWLAAHSSYFLVDEQSWECLPVRLAEVETRPDNFAIRFEGHTAPEPLKHLTGLGIYRAVRAGELPRAEGEVYYFELEGLEVRRPDGQVLGRVVEVWDNGAQTILDVEGAIRRSIPYQAEFIGEVNLAGGYLICTYPLDFVTEDA